MIPIKAMADASYGKSAFHIERYQLAVQSKGHALINQYDEKLRQEASMEKRAALREQANQKIADIKKRNRRYIGQSPLRTEQPDEGKVLHKAVRMHGEPLQISRHHIPAATDLHGVWCHFIMIGFCSSEGKSISLAF